MNIINQWEAIGFEFPQADEEYPDGVIKILVDTKEPRLSVSKNTIDMLNAAFREAIPCKGEEVAARNAEWLQEIQTHPEFGGRNLDHTSESVLGLLRRFGTPLLGAQIRQMNMQNWPEMFYFLARIANKIDRLE